MIHVRSKYISHSSNYLLLFLEYVSMFENQMYVMLIHLREPCSTQCFRFPTNEYYKPAKNCIFAEFALHARLERTMALKSFEKADIRYNKHPKPRISPKYHQAYLLKCYTREASVLINLKCFLYPSIYIIVIIIATMKTQLLNQPLYTSKNIPAKMSIFERKTCQYKDVRNTWNVKESQTGRDLYSRRVVVWRSTLDFL